ncbi:exodeoxyribonuclease III [Vulgatibacter sp.]|uniref:exodeoxyribonuclease III n=1 Tax=Vulgatibacter sp. TaxID=1971226 RepID=UPI00356735A6
MAAHHRIYSWNVNGIRAAVGKGFSSWLEGCDAEIVGLQEVRCPEEKMPAELQALAGWHGHVVAAERAGYSGVGLYARRAPDELITSLDDPDFDAEGRVQIARFGKLWLANVYFPNGSGKDRSNDRVPFKLAFYRALQVKLEPLFTGGEPVLVMGDWNTAPEAIDLARPKANEKTSGFLPEERDEVRRWIEQGWVDTFRHYEQGEGHYTWWSQRFGVREKNIGWRIDLVLASPGALPWVRGAAIHPEVKGSDHCPISVDLDPKLLGKALAEKRRARAG